MKDDRKVSDSTGEMAAVACDLVARYTKALRNSIDNNHEVRLGLVQVMEERDKLRLLVMNLGHDLELLKEFVRVYDESDCTDEDLYQARKRLDQLTRSEPPTSDEDDGVQPDRGNDPKRGT